MKKTALVSLAFMLAISASTYSKTITVKADGTGDYPTIQDAIDAAEDYDIVLIADGIYTGNDNRNLYIEEKTITVTSENGPNNCIIDCGNIQGSFNVGFIFPMHHTYKTDESIVDGLSITNGSIGIDCGERSPTINNCIIYKNKGYGIFCWKRCHPTITNCAITSNGDESGGGGIYCHSNNSPKLINCDVSNNTDSIYCRRGNNSPTVINCNISNNSRGIFCKGGSDLTIKDSTITNNNGGGIYCEQDNVNITNSRIEGNYSTKRGFLPPYAYGGIACWGNLTITNSTIKDNTVFGMGIGGIYCGGNLTIAGSTIKDNTVSWGFGGISCGGNLIMSNCTVSGNWPGGIICGYHYSPWERSNITPNQLDGIFSGSVTSTITNSVITGNGYYGGIYCCGGPLTINSCTISGNTGRCNTEYGCYDYIGGGIHCDYTDLTFVNSILWGNKAPYGPQIALRHSNALINYSNVHGGPNDVYVDRHSDIIWGLGNIDADSCFVDPGYWADVCDPNIIVEPNDPNAVWVEGDYHLLRTSPCVDVGTDANNYVDIEGNARPFDFPGVDNNGELPEFDMGAYELVPVEAKMQLTPQTLNCRGKGKWVKAHITIAEGFYPEDVDVNEPAVAYPMEAESEYITILGGDKGPVRLEVVFSREAFCEGITGDYLDVTVIGSLTTSQYFSATDTIKVTNKGRKNK